MTSRYAPGDHNVICDRTGFQIKASEGRMQWNGLFVRKKSWEPRHPQERVRAVTDDARPTIVRPRVIRYVESPVTVDDL